MLDITHRNKNHVNIKLIIYISSIYYGFCFTFSQDELQIDVNNLQDDIRCDPTGLKELQTKLMELESRLEAYKGTRRQ